MDWDDTHKHYVMKERDDAKPLIIWTPVLDDKDKFKVLGRPDQSGTFNQPTIYVNPIQSFSGKHNPQGFPLLDLKNFNDYILVFPADSGIPPIYVYFSKRYDSGVVTGHGETVFGIWYLVFGYEMPVPVWALLFQLK